MNLIAAWLNDERVSDTQRGKFQAKIDLLELGGPELSQGFLTSTPIARDIYKMKIHGPMQLRPMACKGPIREDSEYTILLGWIERNDARVPHEVKEKAQANRRIVLADQRRRVREPIG